MAKIGSWKGARTWGSSVPGKVHNRAAEEEEDNPYVQSTASGSTIGAPQAAPAPVAAPPQSTTTKTVGSPQQPLVTSTSAGSVVGPAPLPPPPPAQSDDEAMADDFATGAMDIFSGGADVRNPDDLQPYIDEAAPEPDPVFTGGGGADVRNPDDVQPYIDDAAPEPDPVFTGGGGADVRNPDDLQPYIDDAAEPDPVFTSGAADVRNPDDVQPYIDNAATSGSTHSSVSSFPSWRGGGGADVRNPDDLAPYLADEPDPGPMFTSGGADVRNPDDLAPYLDDAAGTGGGGGGGGGGGDFGGSAGFDDGTGWRSEFNSAWDLYSQGPYGAEGKYESPSFSDDGLFSEMWTQHEDTTGDKELQAQHAKNRLRFKNDEYGKDSRDHYTQMMADQQAMLDPRLDQTYADEALSGRRAAGMNAAMGRGIGGGFGGMMGQVAIGGTQARQQAMREHQQQRLGLMSDQAGRLHSEAAQRRGLGTQMEADELARRYNQSMTREQRGVGLMEGETNRGFQERMTERRQGLDMKMAMMDRAFSEAQQNNDIAAQQQLQQMMNAAMLESTYIEGVLGAGHETLQELGAEGLGALQDSATQGGGGDLSAVNSALGHRPDEGEIRTDPDTGMPVAWDGEKWVWYGTASVMNQNPPGQSPPEP